MPFRFTRSTWRGGAHGAIVPRGAERKFIHRKERLVHINLVRINAQSRARHPKSFQKVHMKVRKLDPAVKTSAQCFNHAGAQDRLSAMQQDFNCDYSKDQDHQKNSSHP